MDELIPIVAILCVIGLPMMGLVIRFALMPMAEKITTAIRGAREEEISRLRERVATLEDLVDNQGKELDRVVEAERFHRELSSESSG